MLKFLPSVLTAKLLSLTTKHISRGLTRNEPLLLVYLNTHTPVSCAVWGDLGDVALLEEVCH